MQNEEDPPDDKEMIVFARQYASESYALALPGLQRLRAKLTESYGELVLAVRDIYKPNRYDTGNAVDIIRPIGTQYSLGLIATEPLIVSPDSFELHTRTHAVLIDAPGIHDKPMTLAENISFRTRDAILGLLSDFPEMGHAPVMGEYPFELQSRCSIYVGDDAVHEWSGRTFLNKAVLNTLEEALYDRLSVHPAAA